MQTNSNKLYIKHIAEHILPYYFKITTGKDNTVIIYHREGDPERVRKELVSNAEYYMALGYKMAQEKKPLITSLTLFKNKIAL